MEEAQRSVAVPPQRAAAPAQAPQEAEPRPANVENRDPAMRPAAGTSAAAASAAQGPLSPLHNNLQPRLFDRKPSEEPAVKATPAAGLAAAYPSLPAGDVGTPAQTPPAAAAAPWGAALTPQTAPRPPRRFAGAEAADRDVEGLIRELRSAPTQAAIAELSEMATVFPKQVWQTQLIPVRLSLLCGSPAAVPFFFQLQWSRPSQIVPCFCLLQCFPIIQALLLNWWVPGR